MRRSALLLMVAFCIALLLLCAGFTLPLEFVAWLAVGWIPYIGRVIPQVEFSPGGFATGLLAALAFGVGLHCLLLWLQRRPSTSSASADSIAAVADPSRRSWPVRRTAQIVTVVLVMFVAGISMVGISHQIAWLATSKEPLVGFSSIREAAWRNNSLAKAKQLGIAVDIYEQQHSHLPAGATVDPRGRLLHGWQAALLPHLEELELFKKIDFDEPWDSTENAKAFQEVLEQFLNPSVPDATELDERGFALSHYSGNVFVLGGDRPRKLAEFTDGRGKTILLGEAAGNFSPWGKPNNCRDPRLGLNRSPDGFGGHRPNFTVFGMADGSARSLSDDIDPDVLKALATPNGGEAIPEAD